MYNIFQCVELFQDLAYICEIEDYTKLGILQTKIEEMAIKCKIKRYVDYYNMYLYNISMIRAI